MITYALSGADFEGPLDLLLHLIQKAKIEPKDIFVSEITEQYLHYVDHADFEDLDTACEFLQIAATLLYIKSRALLPRRVQDEDLDEDGLSPEDRLVKRLTEYQQYKEASVVLAEMAETVQGQFYKLPEEIPPEDGPPSLVGADVDMLTRAFLSLIKKVDEVESAGPPIDDLLIRREQVTMSTQTQLILGRLAIKDELSFFSLFSDRPTREEIVVTFSSLLELLAQERIGVRQDDVFSDIEVFRKNSEEKQHG